MAKVERFEDLKGWQAMADEVKSLCLAFIKYLVNRSSNLKT